MVNLVQDLMSISYVKVHTTEIVKYAEDSKNSVVITQNGEKNRNII